MELKINNNTEVKSLQNEFNAMYPYLKIEFVPKKDAVTSNKSDKTPSSLLFRQLKSFDHDITINVDGNRTVADVEKDFREIMNLQIQLYRRSGNVWIETSLTDDWTLEHQNQSGEILSIPSMKKPTA